MNFFPKEFTKQTEETQTLTQFQGLQFPRIEGEDDAIRQAYLAVMMLSSSPSHHSSSRGQIQENLTRDDYRLITRKTSAFSRFMIRPFNYVSMSYGQNMLKRSVTFFKNLYLMNRQEGIQMNRARSTQVHHMISERKRREKLRESFQHLRSLLPPGTKVFFFVVCVKLRVRSVEETTLSPQKKNN